jgi:hypothetical protein
MKAAYLIATALLAGTVGVASAESPVNYPDNNPGQAPVVSTKTRAQVKAELAEARRLGLIVYGEVNDKVATPEQENLIAEAGRRAVTEVASQ